MENITLEGRGTIDGQAEYQWRLNGEHLDCNIYSNQMLAQRAGVPLDALVPHRELRRAPGAVPALPDVRIP